MKTALMNHFFHQLKWLEMRAKLESECRKFHFHTERYWFLAGCYSELIRFFYSLCYFTVHFRHGKRINKDEVNQSAKTCCCHVGWKNRRWHKTCPFPVQASIRGSRALKWNHGIFLRCFKSSQTCWVRGDFNEKRCEFIGTWSWIYQESDIAMADSSE